MAEQDGLGRTSDGRLLDRAAELRRDFFRQADDLLAEAKRRQAEE